MPGKAQHQSNCICVYNIDISSGGCPIAIDPKTGEFDRSRECSYCYAAYVHRNYIKEKEVNEKEWIKFKNSMTLNVMRIGKNLEPGHKDHRETLYEVLRLNNKYELRSILITKLLEFDKRIVELVKDQRSTIHYSMGKESMETGAVLNGSTNDWRLETAKKYADAGVNTYLRIVEDIAVPMREETKGWCRAGLPVLITPLRYNSKRALQQYRPDADWDELKSSTSYEYAKGYLKPIIWHSDYEPYKERCGDVAGKEYCNNCGLGKISRRILEYA